MSLWTTTLLTLLFLQTAEPQTELAKADIAVEEVNKTSEELPHRVDLVKKGWNLNQAYSDVYNILSTENTCSTFYGGPRPATTVLNAFVSQIKYEQNTSRVEKICRAQLYALN